MNWDMIGAIAELVGALAVVLTLAYLAFQVKQSNLAGSVSAKQEMTRQFADYSDLLLQNPILHSVYIRGLAGEELDTIEKAQFNTLMGKASWYFAAMHFQYSTRTVSDDEWKQSRAMIAKTCSLPAFKRWWEPRSNDYSPEYTSFINNLIKEAGV